MAYYDDGYIWAQEYTTFYPVAYQDPISFSIYEPYGYVETTYDASNVSVFHETKCIDHGDYRSEYDYSYNYGYDYDKGYDYGDCHNWYSSPNPCINYLEQNYMEPKLNVYEPVECDTGYVSYHTQYSISYSKADPGFNEPKFEEYDPTPYGGGYDIISVYGKPLPASDKTCYPHSKSKAIGPVPSPSSESQPKTKANPQPEPKPKHMPIATAIPLPEPKAKPDPHPKHILIPAPVPLPKPEPKPVPTLVPVPEPLELNEVGKRENDEYSYPGYGYDYPWPEYENANATRVGYDYGYGKQVVQVPPCEYSPEVVDFCESIFGNWPCLARIRNQQMGNDNKPHMSCSEIGHLNPWEECANYFFGRPIISYKDHVRGYVG